MAYTKEQIEDQFTIICNRLEEGVTLTKAVTNHSTFDYKTFTKYRKLYTKLNTQIENSIEIYFQRLDFENIDIADDDSNDLIKNSKGDEIPNSAAVQRARLRVDTRLKSKGTRQGGSNSGGLDSPTIVVQIGGKEVKGSDLL